ncbi:MAG: lipopolysaccharide core heptose(I) kinase RfaP [Methylophilus sp.]|nr:lipopolysaccharide core heptose(I) kinase RfaP [Methylophilus sp.]
MSKLLHIPDAIKQQLAGKNHFQSIMQLHGKPFRDVAGRKTIQVQLGGQPYFVKQHFGVGWGEILKNILSLKKPILGALTEVTAIQQLVSLGIPTTPLVAYGQQGWNPASLQSFVMTEDLGDIVSLEDLCADWKITPPDETFKQTLIIAVAQLAAKLHQAGLCHRDFYLCHFVMKQAELKQGVIQLYLIDLHRMLQNQASTGQAVMKDIAGLYFSAMDCGLNEVDMALFKTHYLPQNETFWQQVCLRAHQLHAKFNSAKFQKRLAAEKSAIRE